MHDPIQDRLMIAQISYFRLKRLRLGGLYEAFLKAQIPKGGTVICVDCRLAGPVSRAQQQSPRQHWVGPPPTHEMAEAEWGVLPKLGGDVERLAHDQHWRLRWLVFTHPEDLSPVVSVPPRPSLAL
jgi:hypothetical protein